MAIDIVRVQAAVQSVKRGAVILFLGCTRDSHDGRGVVRLEYEAYEPMAIQEMKQIRQDIIQKWPETEVAIVHRLGVVPQGEVSVAIAVASPHRESAYMASRFAIDTLKERVPIWKKEIYTDGSVWKENKEVPNEE
jgi:molybdopterin synthase catalytic subunit